MAFVRAAVLRRVSSATAANGPQFGKTVKLALTDPDSNEVVPPVAARFGGDFMLTSQGDKEQIYVHGAGTGTSTCRSWRCPSRSMTPPGPRPGTGPSTPPTTTADTVDVVSGMFWPGTVFVTVTPCDASNAPATCPGPGFPANYLGQLNMYTGQITLVKLTGASASRRRA